MEKFFDRVNHDVLMARVARKVKDKRVLGLIRRYLQAGVMPGGVGGRREQSRLLPDSSKVIHLILTRVIRCSAPIPAQG